MVVLAWQRVHGFQTLLVFASSGVITYTPPLAKERRRGWKVVSQNHPLDLRGWWHRPHIPMRGEEVCDGFSSLSAIAYDSCRVPVDLSVRWGGAGNSSNVRRVAVLPVGGVQASSYINVIKIHYLPFIEALGHRTDAGVDGRGGGGG